jgi:hypothetical protein
VTANVSPDPLNGQVRRLFASLTHAAGCPVEPAPPGLGLQVQGEAGRERRGTRVSFILGVQGNRIVWARYRAYGCPHTLAVCEWLAGRLESEQGAALGTAADWAQALDVPASKLGRLLVVEDALQSALAQIRLTTENVVK